MTATFPTHLVSDVVLRDGSTVRGPAARPERRDAGRGLPDRPLARDPTSALLVSGDRRRRARPQDRRRRLRRPPDVARPPGRGRGADDRRRSVHPHGGRASRDQPVGDRRVPGSGASARSCWASSRRRPPLHDITTFVADVLPENHAMINVFRASGFTVSIRATPGSIEVEFPIRLTDEAVDQFEHRETEAAVERDADVPLATIGRRDRRVAGLLVDRRPPLPQPADVRVPRSRVSR